MKIVSQSLLLLCLCFLIPSFGNGIAVNPLDVQLWDPRDTTFQEYPYKQFAAEISIFDLSALEEVRMVLNSKDYEGEAFLLNYLDYHLGVFPPDFSKVQGIDSLLQLGTLCLGAAAVKKDPTYLFETFADRIFSTLSEEIQREVNNGNLSRENEKVNQWIEYLKNHQYLIHLEISDIEKGLHHAGQGNWSYLLKRVWRDHGDKIIIASILGSLFLFGMYRWGYYNGKRNSTK